MYVYVNTCLSTYPNYFPAAHTFSLTTAEIFEPASSQDLLWVAGRSSLTSLTRDSWLGSVSGSLTCIHLGYTPEGYLL